MDELSFTKENDVKFNQPVALRRHRAILQVQLVVSDIIEKTGECSGHSVSEEELKKYGLAPTMILAMDGFDKDDCLKKLRWKMDEIQAMCNTDREKFSFNGG